MFTVGYVRCDANTLQQCLCLPSLSLQVRIVMARGTSSLHSTLCVSLRVQNKNNSIYHNAQTENCQGKKTATRWQVLPSAVKCSYYIHPSSSSPLLFSFSPLESERSAASSSPAPPSAHSCQTYYRRRKKRLWKSLTWKIKKSHFFHSKKTFLVLFIYDTKANCLQVSSVGWVKKKMLPKVLED